MKSFKKKWTALAALAVSVILALSAFTVSAATALDDNTKTAIAEEVGSFLDQVLTYSDDELNSLASQGDFYEVMSDAILEERETLGDYVSHGDVTVDDSGDQVTATTEAQFKNYKAEVILYFDADELTPKNFVINPDYPLSVKMSQAGENFIIGMITVFVMLFFLAFVISLFKYINPDARKKKKAKAAEAAETASAPAAPAAAPAPAVPAAASAAAESEEDEIAAVVAAAIAAAEADMPSANGYVVRSIKRNGSARGWKRA